MRFNKNVSEQSEPSIDKPNKQNKILYKDEDIEKSISKSTIKPGSELVKYKPKYNFTFGKFLSYIIVFII